MMDHPDTPDTQHTPATATTPELRESQGKLILPAPVKEYSPVDSTQKTMLRPEPLLPPRLYKREAVSQQPLAKLGYYWRKDPAYKVFMIATCMVMIAGIILVTLASAEVIKHPKFFSFGSASTASQNPSALTPSGRVDFQPVFPTPGGGNGSTESSQPPVVSTPALPTTPTPGSATPTPSGSGGQGQLTVQITSIPQQVLNGQTVQVAVNTSLPGASVRIQVAYNAPPYFYVSGTQQTDGNGNALLLWSVRVGGFGRGHIIARVMAIAVLNGQRASSQQITVQVTTVG